MTQCDRVLALVATLSVGLLPGCLHFSRSASEEGHPAEVRQPTAANVPTAAVREQSSKAPSPYAAVPTPPMAPPLESVENAEPPPEPPPNTVCPEAGNSRVAQAVPDAPDPNSRPLQASPAETVPTAEPSPLSLSGGQVIQIYPKPDPDPPLLAALRCLLDKRPDDAVTRLKGLDKANQDVLLCLLPLAARLGQGALDRASPSELTVMVDQADGVAAPLRRRAPLVIDQMCFCRRIDKFGQYESLPDRHEFHPGELVQVYAELRNFSSDAGKAGFETRLASSVRLTCHTADDRTEVVWRQDFHDRDRVDWSRSPRRDYFNNYRFCIPENIPHGTYKLWLKVIDVPTGRSAESSLPLVVNPRMGP